MSKEKSSVLRGWINMLKPFLVKGKIKEFVERVDLNETFKRSELDNLSEHEKNCIFSILLGSINEGSLGGQEIMLYIKENIEWYKNFRYLRFVKEIKRSEIKSKEELEMFMIFHHNYTPKLEEEFPYLVKDEKGNIITCEDYIDDHYLLWKKDYNEFGNEIYYEDSNGNIKYFEYDSNNNLVNIITDLVGAKRKYFSYKRKVLKQDIIKYITENPDRNISYNGKNGPFGKYHISEKYYDFCIKDINCDWSIFYEDDKGIGYIRISDIDNILVYKNSPKNERLIEERNKFIDNLLND